MSEPKRIAVIGAGPIGLEAALCGSHLGHDVAVFERGTVGANVLRWGFVNFFSPWEMNHSELGASQLPAVGAAPLTGNEYVERYLRPLAESPRLAGRVHQQTEVLSVGRDTLGKPDRIGGNRDEFPFRLLVADSAGERVHLADVVMDCSGTFGHPNWMGNGGIPALGERRLRNRIGYELEDIAGTQRERYDRRRILIVGDGYSAVTALDALRSIDFESVNWVARKDRDRPHTVIEDDPLPERSRLSRLANRLAAGEDPRIRYRPGTVVERVTETGDGFTVGLRKATTSENIEVDRILALVGYSPDNSIYRELQIHECFATEGPMKLAATLLASGSQDCLSQRSAGAETLITPEPNFFILGAKSFGRNSSFLIRLGIEQIREVYSLISSRPAGHGDTSPRPGEDRLPQGIRRRQPD